MALLCCFAVTGCSTSKEEEKDAYVIGIDDTFAPMGFKNDTGDIVGFDVELAKEVSKIIGKDFTFQNIDWDLKETELASKNIDLIWNGYSITDDRKEKVLFSEPYMENRQIIISTKANQITTKADLKDKVVSVQKKSSAYEAVMKDASFVSALKNSELVQYETNNDCFMDLEAGRSDAIVVDETLARYYMKQQKDNIYYVLEENFGTEEYAIGMRKEDTALCKEVNDAIQQLRDNGTFDKIKGNWFQE